MLKTGTGDHFVPLMPVYGFEMRLDKYLAESGLGTRTQVKALLRAGKVTVDGMVVKDPGLSVMPGKSTVIYNGDEVAWQKTVWYMMNKPAGVVTASTDARHRTVMNLLTGEDVSRRKLFPVGRLDIDTTGLLLITDDGVLAHHLLSPARHVEKEYEACLAGIITEDMVRAFALGLQIGDDKPTAPAVLTVVRQEDSCATVRIILHEGRYHQVKRMALAAGTEVLSLRRLRMGPVVLDPALLPGQYRSLTREETELLYEETKHKVDFSHR